MKYLLLFCILLLQLACMRDEDVIDPDILDFWNNFNIDNGMISNNITSLFEDSQKNLWIGTAEGIMQYKDGIFIDFYNINAIAGSITAITEGLDGVIYAGSEQGLGIYQNGVWNFISDIDGTPLGVIALYTTNDGVIWMGTIQKNIVTLDSSGFTFLTITGCDWCNYVFTFFEDTQDYLWFGTAGGLVGYDGNSLYFFNMENGLLKDNFVLSVEEDCFGKLWIGTLKGNEVTMMDVDESNILYVSLFNNIESSGISAIEALNSGEIWFGANVGGIFVYDGVIMRSNFDSDGPKLAAVKAIIQDSGGDIWIGTTEQGLWKYISN